MSDQTTYPAYGYPSPTLQVRPHDRPRMAGGQGGSLRPPCMTLSFATPCRFIPALSSRVARRHAHFAFLRGFSPPQCSVKVLRLAANLCAVMVGSSTRWADAAHGDAIHRKERVAQSCSAFWNYSAACILSQHPQYTITNLRTAE
jgi:hypothetical protein